MPNQPTGKFHAKKHLPDFEGDSLGHSHTHSSPQDTVSTNLSLGAVFDHCPKETHPVTQRHQQLLITSGLLLLLNDFGFSI